MVARSTFDAAAIKIFDSFGDLILNGTLSQPGAWNPVTETQTPTTEAVRVAVRDFTRAEQIASRGSESGKLDIMTGDQEAVIIQSELTATPAIDDTLILSGVSYLVRGVTDTQGVIWRLHLRRV